MFNLGFMSSLCPLQFCNNFVEEERVRCFTLIVFLLLCIYVCIYAGCVLDWLQSLKHFFINVSYHILVASLTLMALF